MVGYWRICSGASYTASGMSRDAPDLLPCRGQTMLVDSTQLNYGNHNKKAVLSQGNRAMPSVNFDRYDVRKQLAVSFNTFTGS